MSSEKILIVDDEPPIRELVRLALESAGYTALYEADDGDRALTLAQKIQPDLILLDLMLPEVDGLTVCRKLKAVPETMHIPIIMLTAKSEESDVVLGLEMGANDYVTKPFSRKILIARVRAQLRTVTEDAAANEIRRAGLVINEELHMVKLDGETIELTRSEFAILQLLAAHPGRVYTRNQIILRIKGEDYPVTERAVDVQMVNLRRKLHGWGAENIETVRGIGYRLSTAAGV